MEDDNKHKMKFYMLVFPVYLNFTDIENHFISIINII